MARDMSAPMLALYGAGTILGAGIYVLIGKIAGEAGMWTPVAFALAALLAAVNGLVYAELATRAPDAGGPADYIDKAFGRQWFAILIGWMIVVTGVVSAATITTGSAGYLRHFFDLPAWLPLVGLPLLLGGIAAIGVKESAWFMAISTSLGIIGLGVVLVVGFTSEGETLTQHLASYWENMPPIGDAGVATGILAASFLAVYSFIGFEDIVHMAEEVKKPSRSIPLAIVAALGIAGLLYVLVSIAALMVVTPAELAGSEAPLVMVVERAGLPGWPLGLLSLWIVFNGALAQIIMATRVIYGLRERGGSPGFLAKIHSRTQTPLNATVVVSLVILGLALLVPLKALASATSLVMLLVFAASNAALILIERREPDAPFDVPRWLPWVGLVASVLMIAAKFTFGGGGH